MRRERRSLFFVRCDLKAKTGNHEALDRRFHEAFSRQPVECPVCAKRDNDWPEREGLCLECWCAAFQVLTNGIPAGENEPALSEIQAEIGLRVHDGREYPAFAERIRKYRESTGTLRRNPATPAIPEQPEPPSIPEQPEPPTSPRKRVKRQISEAEREYQRRYRESHRARINAQKRRWYEANKAKAMAAVRRWKREHREEWNRYQREHNAARSAGEGQ